MTERTSTDIIVEAPMSFTGAKKRTGRWLRAANGWLNQENPWVRWLVIVPLLALFVWPGLAFVLFTWWSFVVAWYATFGLLLVPYRATRRSSRRRKLDDARQLELLRALDRS